jgi:hypothetical protein
VANTDSVKAGLPNSDAAADMLDDFRPRHRTGLVNALPAAGA